MKEKTNEELMTAKILNDILNPKFKMEPDYEKEKKILKRKKLRLNQKRKKLLKKRKRNQG